MICLSMIPITGCVVPLGIVATEVAPRAINGKGLVEDGADVVTGKDCRVIEGAVRDDRKICETRNSRATTKDFKGLSGLAANKTPQ